MSMFGSSWKEESNYEELKEIERSNKRASDYEGMLRFGCERTEIEIPEHLKKLKQELDYQKQNK